jgi:hypothetical protein
MLKKLIILSIFLFADPSIYACSCGVKPTVLEMLDGAKNVFTARIVSIEHDSVERAGKQLQFVKGAHAIVQKVYLGTVKPGDKVFFEQGGGSDCIVTFNNTYGEKTRDDTGQEFLVYDYDNSLQNIRLNYCGRLGNKEDYAYLDNMDRLRGKTRLSGWYRPWLGEKGVEERLPKNPKILINDNGSEMSTTYVATVDDEGFFEIYDIPPGEYRIIPEIPPGLAIDLYSLRYSYLREDALFALEGFDGTWFPLRIEEGGHARLDFEFTHHNPIKVKVVGPKGKPLKGVMVSLLRESADKPAPFQAPFAYTDENGLALITDARPGRYSLLVNPMNEVRVSNPFPTIYYPATSERKRADVFDIPIGGLEKMIVFRIGKRAPTVFIEGVLTYADGTPAAGEYVDFKPAKPKRSGYDDSSSSKTDENGRFRIVVIAGAIGYLQASDYVYKEKFKNCPDVFDRLQKDTSATGTSFSVETRSGNLNAAKNIINLTLKLPFSFCGKQE